MDDGWRPIETAPISENVDDPKHVLFWVSDPPFGHANVVSGFVRPLRGGRARPHIHGWVGDFGITHWRPLPAPPEPTP